jgi:hypothetical protein
MKILRFGRNSMPRCLISKVIINFYAILICVQVQIIFFPLEVGKSYFPFCKDDETGFDFVIIFLDTH